MVQAALPETEFEPETAPHAATGAPLRQGMPPARDMPGRMPGATPEGSPHVNRKAKLLLDAASGFCSLARPRNEDTAVFREFFSPLIGACASAARRSLAAMIAPNAYVPRSVVFYLALDELEVAAPILLLSPVLKEADLVALARKL
ncbi:MAG: hypothetical protein VYD64_00615, partial [Pseudomonadota bacterium]|nr:hypothetical protein [Pseudomonadota bacterium]